jgi:beta-fructofuranosidase
MDRKKFIESTALGIGGLSLIPIVTAWKIESKKENVDGLTETNKNPEYRSPIHFKPNLPKKKAVGDVMPFYWKGEYHVFYLTNPLGNHDVNWEHCSSTDLLNWKEYPPALKPDKEDPTGPDGGCMFTGCIVEKDGIFYAWYTSWNPKNPKGREFLSLATSKDLITWDKHPEHRIAPDGIHYANHQARDFRDPQIFWNEDKKEYWMHVLATAVGSKKFRFGLLTSKDLIQWEQKPEVNAEGDECPDYFRIGDTHYIHGCRRYCYSENINGPYRSPKLTNEMDLPILHAAKRIWDGERHVWFCGTWHGKVMAIPREIYAGPEGLLYMKPVEEVLSLYRQTVLELSNTSVNENVFEVPEHYMLDCRMKFLPDSTLSLVIGGHYRLTLDSKQGELSLTGPGIDRTRPCPMDIGKSVKIQVFVEGNLIECFVNDQFAQTCIVKNPKTRQLGMNAEASSVDIIKMQVKTHR